MKKFIIIIPFILLLNGCKVNSSGWPIIPFMHNGTPVQKAPTQSEINTVNNTNLFKKLP